MTLEKRMVDLLNGSWKVTTIDGKKITEENPTMVIDIPEAKLSGFAGCNRMFGGISLDGTAFGIAFRQLSCSIISTTPNSDNHHRKSSIRKYKATITCPLKKEQDKKIILIKIKKRRRYRPAFFLFRDPFK